MSNPLKIRLIVIGAAGQLGQCLHEATQLRSEFEFVGLDRSDIDIREQGVLEEYLRRHPSSLPTIVINCAAYTAVDRAESDDDEAYAVNAYGAGYLAASCLASDLMMIQISTDYVFSGEVHEPIDEDAEPQPLSVYGQTKYMGEYNVRHFLGLRGLILRTSWLYSPYGANFVSRMRSLASELSELRIVSDQLGSPTYAPDLAEAILLLCRVAVREGYFRSQILHYCGAGVCSWYDLAEETIRRGGYATAIYPITTLEYPTPAKRPAYSALSCVRIEELYGIHPRPWREALEDYYQTIMPH